MDGILDFYPDDRCDNDDCQICEEDDPFERDEDEEEEEGEI